MKTKACPICSEWKYKSLVKTCPLCGRPGGIGEVKSLAEDFLKQLGFEKLWESLTPADPAKGCPNSGEPGWEPRPFDPEAIYHRKS
jgi:hypothetical protein